MSERAKLELKHLAYDTNAVSYDLLGDRIYRFHPEGLPEEDELPGGGGGDRSYRSHSTPRARRRAPQYPVPAPTSQMRPSFASVARAASFGTAKLKLRWSGAWMWLR